jgi:hypothetical protein
VAKIEIDFQWRRAFAYELAGSKRGPVIRQMSGRLEQYSPLQTHQQLYLLFAKLDGSPEACLEFASHWGLLGLLCHKGAVEEIDEWKHQIKLVRSWVQTLEIEHGGKSPSVSTPNFIRSRTKITTLDVLLGSSGVPGASLAMVLRPRTLVDAMLLQLAQSAASGNSILACQQCGQWFEAGTEGKRSVSKFCSDRCRFRFNYERRARK